VESRRTERVHPPQDCGYWLNQGVPVPPYPNQSDRNDWLAGKVFWIHFKSWLATFCVPHPVG
jgi:hypothetical protein